ncbi:hypothetical protein GJ744_002391 [Endocarpon pusillum]|uniref:Uncharacterized protein n=1 Tax=Endocarpon pusillum TaxID=364733 RepID=A0A8H7E6H1_9EURO|nr:hypothetical protein GJ744_002391 [Endocarpon pusillum]
MPLCLHWVPEPTDQPSGTGIVLSVWIMDTKLNDHHDSSSTATNPFCVKHRNSSTPKNFIESKTAVTRRTQFPGVRRKPGTGLLKIQQLADLLMEGMKFPENKFSSKNGMILCLLIRTNSSFWFSNSTAIRLTFGLGFETYGDAAGVFKPALKLSRETGSYGEGFWRQRRFQYCYISPGAA